MITAITADFDGGNIEILSIGGATADLAIRADSNAAWRQWFSFRVSAQPGTGLTLRIANAGQSSYPEGWDGYRACVSADGETWVRTETAYDGRSLDIRHVATSPVTHVAYFAPYSLERHERLLAEMSSKPEVTTHQIGESVDGRAITCLTLGRGPSQVWLIGRQHSGETMASWWMEGALARLTDSADSVIMRLLQLATIHAVPLVNMDGAFRGNLRGNAAGVDLNRQWHGPDPAKAPEVAAILAAMDRTGVAFFLDVHGDEDLPHVFTDGCDNDPIATEVQIEGCEAFNAELLKASPAFQTVYGYPRTYAGDDAPGMAARAIARRYGAVSLTLEMPFKDAREAPDPVAGWSPASSRRLGHDCLTALASVLETQA
jgi:murein tripeptide amidase MpaA